MGRKYTVEHDAFKYGSLIRRRYQTAQKGTGTGQVEQNGSVVRMEPEKQEDITRHGDEGG